VNNGPFKLFQN